MGFEIATVVRKRVDGGWIPLEKIELKRAITRREPVLLWLELDHGRDDVNRTGCPRRGLGTNGAYP